MHHPPVDPRVKEAGLTSMYPIPAHPTYRWAMAIDLNRCNGCGACETACYAENNIGVVGADQAVMGREASWLQIQRYGEKRHGMLTTHKSRIETVAQRFVV